MADQERRFNNEEPEREGRDQEPEEQPESDDREEESNDQEPEDSEDTTEEPRERSGNIFSNTFNTIKEKTSDAYTNVKSNISATKVGLTILILVVGIIILGIIGYIIYYLVTTNMLNQNTFLVPNTNIPIVCTQVTQLDGSGIPLSGNGQRQSVTFWIYIYNPEYSPGVMKHVFHRGNKTDDATTAGPYVYLDPNLNKLHILYSALNKADTFNVNGVSYDDSVSGNTTTNYLSNISKIQLAEALRGVTVDYVPVQRWVHIGIVTNETANGGSFTVYVDGELIKVQNIASPSPSITLDGTSIATLGANLPSGMINPLNNVVLDLSKADLDHIGDIFVGGSTSDPIGVGFSGMLSKIRYANYDMNAQDIYSDYLNGPIDSLLAKMGLAAYGLRSPIYKIE